MAGKTIWVNSLLQLFITVELKKSFASADLRDSFTLPGALILRSKMTGERAIVETKYRRDYSLGRNHALFGQKPKAV